MIEWDALFPGTVTERNVVQYTGDGDIRRKGKIRKETPLVIEIVAPKEERGCAVVLAMVDNFRKNGWRLDVSQSNIQDGGQTTVSNDSGNEQ